MYNLFLLPPTIRHGFFTTAMRVSTYALRYSSTSSRSPSPKERTYAEAIRLLDSLQSNRTITSAISSSNPTSKNNGAIPEMLEWMHKAGFTGAKHIGKYLINYIHVAGTKGKGSVCIMVESILLQYQKELNKSKNLTRTGVIRNSIGLYTSPHLVHVRERIRIDGAPISEEMFAKYFFDLWDRFEHAFHGVSASIETTRPGYFRYLTILAFHVFIEEKVGTAIFECGIGGEYDSTNIMPANRVAVTAITRLELDHVGMLGDTVESIAWHKAGIMKKDVPALTIEQVPAAQAVLEKRAQEKESKLTIIKEDPTLKSINLALQGSYQAENASLALAITNTYLKSRDISPIPTRSLKALETVNWPGRCQVLKDKHITWCIDGSHTQESIKSTASWFHNYLSAALKTTNPPTCTILVFNQEGDRDALALLSTLLYQLHIKGAFKAFTYAAFCTNEVWDKEKGEKEDGEKEGGKVDLRLQKEMGDVYHSRDRNNCWIALGNVEKAVQFVRRVADGEPNTVVLVAGSLHLVGGVLEILGKEAEGLEKKSREVEEVE